MPWPWYRRFNILKVISMQSSINQTQYDILRSKQWQNIRRPKLRRQTKYRSKLRTNISDICESVVRTDSMGCEWRDQS